MSSRRIVVPTGWRLVPADPSPAMVAASQAAMQRYRDSFSAEEFQRRARERGGHLNIWVTPFEKHLMRLRAGLGAAPLFPGALTQDEAAAQRREARMARVDSLPPDWKELVHRFGLTIVDAVRFAGVSDPRQAKHLIETVARETNPLQRPASVQGRSAASQLRGDAA